jgi:hypothetical protein
MRAGLAVQGMMLVLASPAAAQGQIMEGGEYLTYGPALPDDEEYGGALPDLASALDVSRGREGGASGRTATRNRIVGSMPLADNADLNLGLISVVHVGARELDRRRTDLSREIRPPESRIAAVGVSLRF